MLAQRVVVQPCRHLKAAGQRTSLCLPARPQYTGLVRRLPRSKAIDDGKEPGKPVHGMAYDGCPAPTVAWQAWILHGCLSLRCQSFKSLCVLIVFISVSLHRSCRHSVTAAAAIIPQQFEQPGGQTSI